MKISELFADPARWTNDAAAVDAKGREVSVDSPQACAWCLIGAIAYCYPRRFHDIYTQIIAEVNPRNLITFNAKGREAVLELVRRLGV